MTFVPARRALAAIALMLALTACGGAGAPTAASSPSATVSPTGTAAAAAWTVTDGSRATVSVREQLVGVNLPSDAVLAATGGSGSFQLKDDGTFTPDSKISFDLTTLTSDESNRDNFIKQDTLQVRQFPKAEFVPTKVTGLTLPMPASGTFTFKLTGMMTIHGTAKEATFDVQAKRNGGELTATATTSPKWAFGDFGMRAPSVPFRVVSVTDEIRLVVDIVATGPKE